MNLTSTLIHNIIYRVLNMITLYCIVVLVSKLTGVEVYGLLSLMVVNATIFNLVSSFGADAGITYHSSNAALQPGKIITIIFMSLIIQLAAIGITEAICFHFTGHYWIFKSYLVKTWWIGVLFLMSISITEKYTALFNGRHLFTLCSKIIFFSNLLTLVVLAALFFYGPVRDAVFIVIIYVLLCIFQSLMLVAIFHRGFHGYFHFSPVSLPEINSFLSFSIVVFVTNIIQFLAYRIDYWFIDHYRGVKELGWYSLAVRLAQIFWVLPLLFAGILFANVSKEKELYNDEKMLSFIRIIFSFNLLAAAASYFLVQWIVPLFFGNIYNESILPFQILLPGFILFCPATVIAAYFAGKGLLKINLLGSIVCFISILVPDILLIPSYGKNGAALASSIGYTITGIYFTCIYCSRSGMPFYKLFYPQKTDLLLLKNTISKTL